ncbi:Putative pre-16S rRNA nuclease [Saliniradius amylolyticus]|uniref:Putative pre-16S rRNA nuclease n=1 Tax=Saliniradius amylolyticus TaxID=2183582 RepID=A0A2S2E6I9_9ALTE|nr:Holliday junction resolvase RuvX [Saliniradius amylolyticus]AWL12870.1 Putative pre-16S rRNA nuclease [Saliniradius amylolyticus]
MASDTYLGFDFGTKSIGVAVGQAITGTAAPLDALKARDGIPDWDKVEALYKEWQPTLVIVGDPLNMDGTEQDLTRRARKFANRLQAWYGVNVVSCDERLTTTDAKARLFELGGYKKLTKDKVDSVSACLILESWMESY